MHRGRFNMDMFSTTRLNVIASESGAGWLKTCASARGEHQRTLLAFSQALLPVGPIAGVLDPGILKAWANSRAPGLIKYAGLLESDWETHRGSILASWQTIKTWDGPITLWYSTRNMAEYSFFVAFLQSIADVLKVDFIDVAAVDFNGARVPSTADCTPEMLEKAYASRFRLWDERLAHERAKTRALFESPSDLQIFRNGSASEASLDAHDAKLLDQLDQTWRPTRSVVAALYEECDRTGFHDLDYGFLNWRLETLCTQGTIVRRGQSKRELFEDCPLMGDVRKAR